MAGKFQWRKFKDVDILDSFFDSLKNDYKEFPEWYAKKSSIGEKTLIFEDEEGVGAFLYLKKENEPLELVDKVFPAKERIKIGTLRLAERYRGLRLGEGALGVALWKWQEQKVEEIYVTVFEKHEELINLFNRFGFLRLGKNYRGECVYLKSRGNIDYSDPYKSFPFIRPDFQKAGLVPIFELFHDRLFPYSELKGNKAEIEEETAGNGITKVYIGTPYSMMHYNVGEPVVIYRIYAGTVGKQYKSAATSFCTITKMEIVKSNDRLNMNLDDFIKMAGNKTIFTPDELIEIFNSNKNVVIIEMIYNGFFGKGHNINYRTLKDNALFETYPYNIDYKKEEFIKILEMGDVNVQNVIID
ncbi:GNAT family N-acetyltransferase [Blautia schinkii]|nr:GNAT family N-acetyltransferase [Blautia schinkii]